MTHTIFAEYSNEALADAINQYLDTNVWTPLDVAEWRERYLENGYMPTICEAHRGHGYFPAIAGSEHSNLDFVWFLEDKLELDYRGA